MTFLPLAMEQMKERLVTCPSLSAQEVGNRKEGRRYWSLDEDALSA